MITLRKSIQRGQANHGWLQSLHSFSFAEYHDPAHMGVGNLRVINEDRIAPGTGFGAHGHRDMEIISYVLSGALAHKDDMAAGRSSLEVQNDAPPSVIRPGDVQRMSAGTGVRHSEFNHAPDQTTHFLQIWIVPNQRGVAPEYEQKHFAAADKRGRLTLVASPDGRDGSLRLHADALMYAGLFEGAESAELALDAARPVYVHVVGGRIEVNGEPLSAGDAATVTGERVLLLRNGQAAEVLVFVLAS